jgi:hypothetical protein
MGIMDTNDFLDTVYYIDGAQGKDGELWKIKNDEGALIDGYVTTDDTYNLNGYYQRIKKINDAILPINEELIGLNADLLEKKAKLEVEEATYEASVTGIEQVREDFVALTGIYPEEAQFDSVSSIRIAQQGEAGKEDTVAPIYTKEDWYQLTSSTIDNENKTVTLNLETKEVWDREYGLSIEESQYDKYENISTNNYKFTKSSVFGGLTIKNDWVED